jgi:hypothetical protein
MSRATLLLVLLCATPAFSQIVYEPVKYQHGTQRKFYYGGSDPRILAWGERPATPTWGRINGWAFASANISTCREVASERERVFTDAIPFQDASYYGFTANDARNEAYGRLPLVFRKADLLQSAYLRADGVAFVPADAPMPVRPGYIVIKAWYGTAAPVSHPRPLMILPRPAERDTGAHRLVSAPTAGK